MKQETVNKSTRTFWRWLSQELTIRMEQNLPFIRVQPKAICLIGVQSQKGVHLLYQRYPTAKFTVDTPYRNGILKKVLAFFHISRPRVNICLGKNCPPPFSSCRCPYPPARGCATDLSTWVFKHPRNY